MAKLARKNSWLRIIAIETTNQSILELELDFDKSLLGLVELTKSIKTIKWKDVYE